MPRPGRRHAWAGWAAWFYREPDPAGPGSGGSPGTQRSTCAFLALDEAVSDGLTGGQRPAMARVLADLIHLAAGDIGQPEVQRVEHARQLLLADGDRGHRAAETQSGLSEHEGGVGVTRPTRAGGEHAESGAVDLAAHAGVHRYPQHVEDAHGQHDPLGQQPLVQRVLPVGVGVQPNAGRRDRARHQRNWRRWRPAWLTGAWRDSGDVRAHHGLAATWALPFRPRHSLAPSPGRLSVQVIWPPTAAA